MKTDCRILNLSSGLELL
jgi:hypothetical protein